MKKLLKIQKFKIIFLSIFLLTTFAKAEIVNKVQILGNKRVSTETIMIYGEVTLNKNYNENDLNNILSNLYSTNFFKNIELTINRLPKFSSYAVKTLLKVKPTRSFI